MSTRAALMVSDEERIELRRLVRQPGTRQALATRCKVVLLDEQGMTYAAIGAKLDMREQTVLKWRSRFLKHRLAGLQDKPRPGVKRTISDQQVAEVVRMTLEAWIARSHSCPCGRARPSVARTTITGTAPAACSRPSWSRPAW